MKTKSTDRVRLSDGREMLLGEAFDRGLIYPKTTKGYGRDATESTHYIAKERGGEGHFWEIGKTLFESRSKLEIGAARVRPAGDDGGFAPNMNRRAEMAAIRAQQKAERAAAPKNPPLRKGDIVHVVGVLAAVYRGSADERGTLSHAVVQGHQKSLCSRISIDHLADDGERESRARPTCALCDKRLGSHPITLTYDTYYVWEMMSGSDEPLTKPSGPWSWDRARDQAEAWAKTSNHDFVVSSGDDPESVSFKLSVRYLARTGEAVRFLRK